MKFFAKFLSVCLCLAALIAAVGCGNNSGDAFIYFELENKPSTLDPQLVSTREEMVIVRSLFDTLLRYDEDGKLVPSACKNYEKDGLVYTFNINTDISWTNGTKLTSHDFVFAIKRAVDPKTNAPAAASLRCIQNADLIIESNADLSALGVSADGDDKLIITLQYDDPLFLSTLATPIAMPCNEEAFNSAKGLYGRNLDNTPSCGSYYIKKWNERGNFLIRMAKNLDYKGYFEARSMRIYFTCDERNNVDMLNDFDTDFAFIGADEVGKINDDSYINSHESESFLMFISPNLNMDVRTALMKSVSKNESSLNNLNGISLSRHIIPSSIYNINEDCPYFAYDLDTARNLYSGAVLKDPTNTLNGKTVICLDDPAALMFAKAITAHWQQNLGAFINIETVSDIETLYSYYHTNDYAVAVMPVFASFPHPSAYISFFNTNTINIKDVEQYLAKESLCYPLFNRSAYTVSTKYIKNGNTIFSYGIPDVALAIKIEQ